MVIKFGEHEPHVQKAEVEREFVECKCGERLWVDEKHPIKNRKGYTNERTIRCPKCGRIYAPISQFRTGSDSCYILLGYLCTVCGLMKSKLYKDGREEEKLNICGVCLRKRMKELEAQIPHLQDRIDFAKEQLEEEDGSTDVEG